MLANKCIPKFRVPETLWSKYMGDQINIGRRSAPCLLNVFNETSIYPLKAGESEVAQRFAILKQAPK
jgi:hypothetical protein